MAQSKDFAFHVCVICSASIRMSWFVPMFFGYQLLQLCRVADHLSWTMLLWRVLQSTGDQFLLLATVLCHEFGHGNMARYLGGEIDHILLWVFGGICFSSRARHEGIDQNRKILRDDLVVVAAGPATHIFQAPFWGLFLWLIFSIFAANPEHLQWLNLLGYPNAWRAFVSALHPLYGLSALPTSAFGLWPSLFWYLVGSAIRLNVALFLFNVFFPMYPADGSKLLVTSLMFCCGLAPRRAATLLLGVSVPCAVLMICYSLYIVYQGISGGGDPGSSMINGLMGFMGVMSLMESWKIYNLRKTRQLNTHPLFQTARSWNRTDRDAFGVVHRINTSELDDDTPLFTGGCGNVASGCSIIGCLCPCFRTDQRYVAEGTTMASVEASGEPRSESFVVRQTELRSQRDALLDRLEGQQAQRQQR